MKHLIKWSSIAVMVLALVALLAVWLSPLIVGAVSGVDNQFAYSEALQASAAALQETLSQMSQGMVNALDKTLAHQFKLFEKAVAP